MRKVFAMLLMASMLCLMLVGCGGGNNDNGGNNGGSTAVTIESLTAKEASTTIKVGESILLKDFYEIKGSAPLSAAQQACTFESSDETVVKINARRAEAVSAGKATITVTSNYDTTKSCSFEVVVAGVFFDREDTVFQPEDDITNEWDDATKKGSIRTNSAITNFYYVDNVCSDKWYVETDITLHAVNKTFEAEAEERWPKVGIIARGEDSTGKETMVVFFLNATLGLNDTLDDQGNTIQKGEDNIYWNEFGVCEVGKGDAWAWQENVTDKFARHHDYWYNTGANTITYNTTFKLGVARDGESFHVYVNGNYAFSHQLSKDLDILMEDNATIASQAGFFQFSSDVTFDNYSVTQDAADVAAKVPSAPNYVTEFLKDTNEQQQ